MLTEFRVVHCPACDQPVCGVEIESCHTARQFRKVGARLGLAIVTTLPPFGHTDVCPNTDMTLDPWDEQKRQHAHTK